MHLKRWITGLILMPVLFSIIYFSGPAGFFILLTLISLIALNEYFSIVFSKEKDAPYVKTVMIFSYLITPLFFYTHLNQYADASVLLLSINLVGLVGLLFFRFGLSEALLNGLLKQIIGIIYIPCFLSFFMLIRNQENGILWILMTFCVVAAGDTGALYSGTFFGKHKLCPTVSPNKTIEGSLGGLLANALIGVLFFVFLMPKPSSYLVVVGFSILIGGVGQLGDLFESSLKRVAQVKDSGNILPGHGGILDRIDALIFVAPIAYLFKNQFF